MLVLVLVSLVAWINGAALPQNSMMSLIRSSSKRELVDNFVNAVFSSNSSKPNEPLRFLNLRNRFASGQLFTIYFHNSQIRLSCVRIAGFVSSFNNTKVSSLIGRLCANEVIVDGFTVTLPIDVLRVIFQILGNCQCNYMYLTELPPTISDYQTVNTLELVKKAIDPDGFLGFQCKRLVFSLSTTVAAYLITYTDIIANSASFQISHPFAPYEYKTAAALINSSIDLVYYESSAKSKKEKKWSTTDRILLLVQEAIYTQSPYMTKESPACLLTRATIKHPCWFCLEVIADELLLVAQAPKKDRLPMGRDGLDFIQTLEKLATIGHYNAVIFIGTLNKQYTSADMRIIISLCAKLATYCPKMILKGLGFELATDLTPNQNLNKLGSIE
ncbi:hypothetical protein NEHOM01_2215, partial [Nematocida homosporus]|uniref:uncharacterized protein n=1 Tax=Nematocida homosporus TaxID=1912981 RepID=UPI00221F95E1